MPRRVGRWRLVAMLLGMGAAALRPSVAQAQPSPPVGPDSRAVCDNHRRAWDEFIRGLSAAHDGCLDANRKNKSRPTADGAFCTDPSCESLHQQRDQARRDANAAVSLCYREVDAYLKKRRDEELAEKKRKEEIEKRKRELEEELKRKQAEMERLQREEEARRQREAEEADKEGQEASAKDEAAEQAQREADARQQAIRDEEERARKAEADRVAEEERARRDEERQSEISKAFDRALEQTKREFEAYQRRTVQRAQAMEQTAQQAAALGQQARDRLASHSASIAQTIDQLRKAVSDWSGTATGAAQKSAEDLVGQFDMGQVASGGGQEEPEPLAKAIHKLIDRTKATMPHRAVEMEYVRSIFDEAYAGPARLQPVFDQIASMEGADPRAADEYVDGYTMRVFGLGNTARIFTEVYGAGTPLAQVASTRERVQQVVAAYEAREPRRLLAAAAGWMVADARTESWWAEDAVLEPQLARDRRGMPIIVGADGKPVGYDDERDQVSYGFDEIPLLLEERGARLLRRGDPAWARTGVLFAPYARPTETPRAAAADMRGWLAGEMVGVALQGGRP